MVLIQIYNEYNPCEAFFKKLSPSSQPSAKEPFFLNTSIEKLKNKISAYQEQSVSG